MLTPVIAIYDVGKTNKKLFLFDESYNIVYERSAQFHETVDEDGDACENLESLSSSLFSSLDEVVKENKFEIKAINFATYGASFVYVDEKGKAVAPLYNYLKAYPENLKKKFYDTYGGEAEFAFRTASPVLGSLNSGMQLYRIKYQKPDLFKKIKYALHLPQYMSFLLSSLPASDITSIGSHTNLWDFTKNEYHDWVKKENIDEKLPPIVPSNGVNRISLHDKSYLVGVGLHDSSAALIPYLVNFSEPFVLISTGTWCISLNPFNRTPLSSEELDCDCLCYMQYKGQAVKASRLFAGYIHDQQVERIAKHFDQHHDFYKSIKFNPKIVNKLQRHIAKAGIQVTKKDVKESFFEKRDLSTYPNAEEAYNQLMYDLVTQQYLSTQLVLKGNKVRRIFVDGGFSKNPLYMNLLASFFPGVEVYAASMAQATAMGAALAIHESWNDKPLPKDLIQLKYYSAVMEPQL